MQHLYSGLAHHRRSAHVVLTVLRILVVLQVHLAENVTDESGRAGPLVLRLRIGQSNVPGEVWELLGKLVEVVGVEHLGERARAVPEADLALGVETLELIEDVRAHRSHSGAAADEDHLVLGVAGEELAERSGDGYLVAGLQ